MEDYLELPEAVLKYYWALGPEYLAGLLRFELASAVFVHKYYGISHVVNVHIPKTTPVGPLRKNLKVLGVQLDLYARTDGAHGWMRW